MPAIHRLGLNLNCQQHRRIMPVKIQIRFQPAVKWRVQIIQSRRLGRKKAAARRVLSLANVASRNDFLPASFVRRNNLRLWLLSTSQTHNYEI